MRHHVYYHMDADGHASAGIIQEYLERTLGKDAKIIFQPINYGMEPFTNMIDNGDAVYMVDFSLQPARKMSEFVNFCYLKGCSVVWIDHHKTALAMEEELPELKRVSGVRMEGQAGCELTWDFFNKERPKNAVIRLVADWDMWRKDADDWETLVVFLQTYLRYVRSDPKHNREFWPKILGKTVPEMYTFLKEVEEKGGMLTTYQRQIEDSKMRGFARFGKFAGYSAIVVNSPQMNSTPFERMDNASQYDLMVAWVMNRQGQFSISIYTKNKEIDLSVLCEKLGKEGPYKSGGGHPGAAGFQTDWEHLSRLMEF